ncbi:MAG TPA: phosphatase PAP2 family protein [Chitinophagaceae bacterium]|nr:phosphatase PAP2 family protein [Chitinophagaceae bacterium]
MRLLLTPCKFLCCISIVLFNTVAAQQNPDSLAAGSRQVSATVYTKPRLFSFITNVPGDIFHILKTPFQRQNLKADLGIAGATALLMHFDQPIMNAVGRTSQHMHLKSVIEFDQLEVHHQPILKWPDNLNSGFYQLGEGSTTMLIAGGFYLYGKISNNNRALQTASDLTEAFLSMGITVQALKRITGRQAPYRARVPGGMWHFFPSFSQYQHHTTNYDAFPSGHLATMMATVTVLANDYPEIKWIRPVGYILTGLTGWSMMNNKVHWASDFPLGLAIGYVSGKIATQRHKKEKLKSPLY